MRFVPRAVIAILLCGCAWLATASSRSPFEMELVIPRHALTREERETVAACLVLEAASEGGLGLRSVMSVVRNRAHGRPELFAMIVAAPWQFSAFNKVFMRRESLAQAVARAQADRQWGAALLLADAAASGDWEDTTGGATHYARVSSSPWWSRNMRRTAVIGSHAFYR